MPATSWRPCPRCPRPTPTPPAAPPQLQQVQLVQLPRPSPSCASSCCRPCRGSAPCPPRAVCAATALTPASRWASIFSFLCLLILFTLFLNLCYFHPKAKTYPFAQQFIHIINMSLVFPSVSLLMILISRILGVVLYRCE